MPMQPHFQWIMEHFVEIYCNTQLLKFNPLNLKIFQIQVLLLFSFGLITLNTYTTPFSLDYETYILLKFSLIPIVKSDFPLKFFNLRSHYFSTAPFSPDYGTCYEIFGNMQLTKWDYHFCGMRLVK